MISAVTFPVPLRDNPGGQHVAPTPLSTWQSDMRTYEPRNFGSSLTAKAAPSRGGECSPDPIHSSGDSLGLHQPGSMTWGGRNATPAPSGRAAYYYAIGLAVTRFTSRGRGACVIVHAPAIIGASRKGQNLIVRPNAGPRETNSRYPSAEERSCVRLIAGHGLTGTANVSAVLSAVMLTNADPDAVKGACELQRMHCPATFHDITRRTLALVVRHAGGSSEPVWGARHRAWTARTNSRPWISATSRGARNPRTLITGSGGRLAIQGRAVG